MKFLIKVSKFRKNYKNEIVFLDDILVTNRITFLLGKNGSGKSTLLKAIGGLINYEGIIKTSGKVVYMSEFTSFPEDLTLSEFIYSLNKVSKTSIGDKDIETLLEIFQLINKKNVVLSSLSKGMKAKVNLVQVLVEKADVYLLDEPINGLDKDGVKCLINYLKQSDKNFLISTHLIDDFKSLKCGVIHI